MDKDQRVYANFASVYDRLMVDISYDAWIDYLKRLFKHFNIKGSKIIDIGCGTGNISIPLATLGFNVTAVDLSPEMLASAENKSREKNLSINFICQDMRKLQIHEKFDVAISMVDSFNYLTEDQDFKETLAGVREVLQPGGFLIFDLNSAYKISEIFGDNTYSLIEDDICYIWENNFDETTKVCTMEITFFVKDKNGLFSRFTEIHQERAYQVEEIQQYLSDSGFNMEAIFGELSLKQPAPKEERIFVIAKKF